MDSLSSPIEDDRAFNDNENKSMHDQPNLFPAIILHYMIVVGASLAVWPEWRLVKGGVMQPTPRFADPSKEGKFMIRRYLEKIPSLEGCPKGGVGILGLAWRLIS